MAGTWDIIASHCPPPDAWIRLQTNYPHHRAVVDHALGSTIAQHSTQRPPTGRVSG